MSLSGLAERLRRDDWRPLKVSEPPGQTRGWAIDLPLFWRRSEALRLRRALLDELLALTRHQRLVLHWYPDQSPTVELPLGDDVLARLDEGAWELLLFDDNAPAWSRPPALPRELDSCIARLEACGAVAGVWSWYDDLNWLLAIADKPDLTPP